MKQEDRLEQKSGNDSTNYQAAGNMTISVGVNYSEVKQIAADVFKANFFELAEQANLTAEKRAEEIAERYLQGWSTRHPSLQLFANDPDLQYAIFSVQKEYARCGDKDLGDILVDLLIDRSIHNQRDILQIVLNEALQTAPKLTNNHLAVLAIIFLFKHTQNFTIINHDALGTYFDNHVLPFVQDLRSNPACYQHLEFAGCGTIGLGEYSLENVFMHHYKGLFNNGFKKDILLEKLPTMVFDKKFFIPCLNDNSNIQVGASNIEVLEKLFCTHSILPENRLKIKELFEHNNMTPAEVKQKCILIRPYMQQVFDIWSNSPMKNINLTSVGIAIGHANIQRFVGKFADLSIWIN